MFPRGDERSGLSNQRVKTILSAEKSARRSETRKQEGKPNCCENNYPCFKETQAIQVRTENHTDPSDQCKLGSSSEQEHKVNALASGADEGRDKLR